MDSEPRSTPRRAQFQEARKELVAENRARYPITCSLISGWALDELKAYQLNSWGVEFGEYLHAFLFVGLSAFSAYLMYIVLRVYRESCEDFEGTFLVIHSFIALERQMLVSREAAITSIQAKSV